jgi:hypothetical protein
MREAKDRILAAGVGPPEGGETTGFCQLERVSKIEFRNRIPVERLNQRIEFGRWNQSSTEGVQRLNSCK